MAQAISKKETTQTAVDWLNENNITVCEMLLINKISETQYEQLINCFSMNLEQAKAMEKEQHSNTWIDARTHQKGDDYIGKEMSFEDYYKQTYNQ